MLRVGGALGALLIACALIGSAAAAQSGLSVQTASIIGGRLVIEGKTAKPRQQVSIQGTQLNTRSNNQRRFEFNVLHRTPNCRLTLATNAGTIRLLIGNCGPREPDAEAGGILNVPIIGGTGEFFIPGGLVTRSITADVSFPRNGLVCRLIVDFVDSSHHDLIVTLLRYDIDPGTTINTFFTGTTLATITSTGDSDLITRGETNAIASPEIDVENSIYRMTFAPSGDDDSGDFPFLLSAKIEWGQTCPI